MAINSTHFDDLMRKNWRKFESGSMKPAVQSTHIFEPNVPGQKPEENLKSWKNIFIESDFKKAKAQTLSSAVWYNVMTRLEKIFRLMQDNKPIDVEMDDVLLILLKYYENFTNNKNFDFVLLVAVQTYLNEARLLYKVNDKAKSIPKMARALEIAIAAEDAKSTAEELGLHPINIKKVDEFDDRPVYTL